MPDRGLRFRTESRERRSARVDGRSRRARDSDEKTARVTRKEGFRAPREIREKKRWTTERRRRHASPFVIDRRFARGAPPDASFYAPARSSPSRPSRGTSPRWSPRPTARRVRGRAMKARTPPRNPGRARAPPRIPGAAPPPRATRRRTRPLPPRARARLTPSHRTAPSGGPPRARRHAASGPACGRARRAVVARSGAVPSLHVGNSAVADVAQRERDPRAATARVSTERRDEPNSACANISAHTAGDGRDEPPPPRPGWSPSCRLPCQLC